jgi:hypothetical protein
VIKKLFFLFFYMRILSVELIHPAANNQENKENLVSEADRSILQRLLGLRAYLNREERRNMLDDILSEDTPLRRLELNLVNSNQNVLHRAYTHLYLLRLNIFQNARRTREDDHVHDLAQQRQERQQRAQELRSQEIR